MDRGGERDWVGLVGLVVGVGISFTGLLGPAGFAGRGCDLAGIADTERTKREARTKEDNCMAKGWKCMPEENNSVQNEGGAMQLDDGRESECVVR